MRQNLLETYSRQLKVAEAYVAKNFDGKQISANTQLTTAVLLDNTNRWMTESMNTQATERSDLGDWKKFCLNLTNIAVPSLIANDLVIVHPMTSYSGSVAYLKYVSKTDKGDVKKGDVFNGVFGLGEHSDARTAFTSQVIVETAGSDGKVALTPMATNRFGKEGEHKDAKVIKSNSTVEYVTADALKAGVEPGALKNSRWNTFLLRTFQLSVQRWKELLLLLNQDVSLSVMTKSPRFKQKPIMVSHLTSRLLNRLVAN